MGLAKDTLRPIGAASDNLTRVAQAVQRQPSHAARGEHSDLDP
jgi:hypothetical protein